MRTFTGSAVGRVNIDRSQPLQPLHCFSNLCIQEAEHVLLGPGGSGSVPKGALFARWVNPLLTISSSLTFLLLLLLLRG